MEKAALTVGLLAHVDAGKTTLSEALLYTAGAVRKLGRVDHRDAFLDTDAQERERGITIFSKQARLSWQGRQITLMDTPGHVDFSGEMERTLSVLDCAVLVISGADGVQAHTRTLWRLLERYQIPCFLFVNKMDQPGTNREALRAELQQKLQDGCVDFLAPDAMEQMATGSENALNHFLETGEIPQPEVMQLIASRRIFPCFFGAALRLDGVEALLNALADYGPRPSYADSFGARVYKIARDPQGARLTYLKITGGCLHVRDSLNNRSQGLSSENTWEEKINQIRLYSGGKFQTVEEAGAGTICAVTGLNHTRIGDGLGAEKTAPEPMLTPVFTYQVLLPQGADAHAALQKLRQLEEEEPQLHVVWRERLREIHVQLMGEVQLEILGRLLQDRFGLSVQFGAGSILYRETIENAVEGVGHYEPLRHYAEVHLLLEPGSRGSGLRFASACSEDALDRNWQRLILTHLAEKQHLGVLTGSPVTDMKITLLAGRAHLKHTEGGDFRQATYRALRQGLMQARSVVLEPWYDLQLELPADGLGRAMNDIQQMGGSFETPENVGDEVILRATAPVARARHYARELAAYTHGKGRIACSLRGYAPCQEQERLVSALGYDPERDVENTADSVFCAHGAGFVVKWNQVREYMHVQTGFGQEHPEQADAPAPVRRAYSGTLEEDKELMAIFERTYGPIRPRSFRTVAQTAPTPVETVYIPPEQEFLLVDGYNIIFAWDDLKAAAKTGLSHARQMLMDILCNYQGVRPCQLILVFDAYKVSNNPGRAEKYNNISVVYTKEAETADNYIEKATYKLGKNSRVRVATSDGLEQIIILGHGALRVSAKEFRREVEAANVEIQAIMAAYNTLPVSNPALERALWDALEKKKAQR